jgi:hypothetical protein
MSDYITIAMTLKNRAEFIDDKFENILYQDYDPKKIEISITDGYSDDDIYRKITKWYKRFKRILYARSDRSVLPFKAHNCAADINAQICNFTTYDKIVRTDAEVYFMDRNTLQYINEKLNNKKLLIWHDCIVQMEKKKQKYSVYGEANFCTAFNQYAYMESGGIEEKFSKGFACEDTVFIRSWGKRYGEVEKSPYLVYHKYHIPPSMNNTNKSLHNRYSLPLMRVMLNTNRKPNKLNTRWMRGEMLKDKEEFEICEK